MDNTDNTLLETEEVSEQVTISNKKGFLYPLIAIIAIVALAVASCFLLLGQEDLTTAKFVKYMENEGYVVASVEGKKHDYIQASKNNICIQFFNQETAESTQKYFDKEKNSIIKYYKKVNQTPDKVIGQDTETFAIVSKQKDSYLRIYCDISEFDTVNKLFEKLGY